VADKARRLEELFADYNTVGLTSVCDRDASLDEIALFKELRQRGRLTVRVSVSQHIDSIGSLTNIQANIRRVAQDPLFKSGRLVAHHRHQNLSRWRDAHGQRLHATALGRERHLRHPRSGIPRRALHLPGAAGADGAHGVECGLQFTAHS